MDKFIKRIQSRVSRQGIKVTKDQVRAVYSELVKSLETPTEQEIQAVTELLCAQNREVENTSIAPQESPQESIQEVPQETMLQAQPQAPQAQPKNSQLATTPQSAIQPTSDDQSAITQEAIKQAVEEQFGGQNVATKTAILNYVAQDTFSTAQELQASLNKLRNMRLDILMKLISDHNHASDSDESLLKQALLNATAKRQQETQDFFANFETQMSDMRAVFGI
ncbi:MAG: hypothetical protein F6K14_17885 [Symploca sp. SIO2C1]|nr:hypothetical protein [Symploca sp. SIO2C1]